MPGLTIDDMFSALKPAAERVALAVGCEVWHTIRSDGYSDPNSGKPILAATEEEATRNAVLLSDNLALTYCTGFGAANFKLIRGGGFTGVVGYTRSGTPIACIIRGFFPAVIGTDGTEERGYVSIASIYGLMAKS